MDQGPMTPSICPVMQASHGGSTGQHLGSGLINEQVSLPILGRRRKTGKEKTAGKGPCWKMAFGMPGTTSVDMRLASHLGAQAPGVLCWAFFITIRKYLISISEDIFFPWEHGN